MEEPAKGIDALKARDTLSVLAGEYRLDAAVVVSGKKGTQAAPIVIQARGPVGILRDGAEKTDPWQGMIDVRNSSWITIRGFSLQQSGFFGIYMDGADHLPRGEMPDQRIDRLRGRRLEFV